ncbi:MFS transporter [Paenibacillus thermotolerans]|uniref:MFS transporter n=1 Tax=Paenibacillus thermotolerans TaxID=3027807 RepID=UPI0023687AC3|nr:MULTISPECIES: MFS transporter [unclassified Paenibacillus]
MEKAKKRKLNISFQSDMDDHSQEVHKHKTNKSSGKEKAESGRLVWEFIAIASVPLVLVLGNSMLVPVLQDMQRELGISKMQSSLVITLFSLTAGIFIPVVGFLSDQFGRKAIIIPSLIVYGGAGILAGFGAVWESYPVIISARAIQGLGAAGTSSIAMALVGDLYNGATESKSLGLIEASNGFGKVVSPIIGSALALIVWYAAFFAFPIFCALALLAVIFLIKEPKEKSTSKQPLGKYLLTIGKILKEKGRWLVTAFFAGSLGLFSLFGILFYLSEILEKKPYSIDGIMKGLVLAIPLAGLVITSYSTGSIIKKNGLLMRWLMNIGLAASALALGLTLIWNKDQIVVFMALITVSSIGTGLLLPCLNTMITGSVDKKQRGMITSIYNSLRFIGVALGPPLIGWLMGISDAAVFILLCSLAAIALALVFFLIKPDKNLAKSS